MAVETLQEPASQSLPVRPHTLLGRQQAVAMAGATLLRSDCRLLTLLGAGGIGKTSLAIAVAGAVTERFADGVCFIDLTEIDEAAAVPSLLAARLGLLVDDVTSLQRVKDYVAQRQMLLLLDNCEHVLSVATMVAELLEGCPELTILATSREPLRLRWEQRLVVSPLELPNVHRLPPAEELAAIPAVALFRQRARAINLQLVFDEEMLRQIAAVCVRLEGVPLAIELAATRINVLSPAAMLRRLDARATVLQQRAPDVPARHQSIQATLDWSYDLLPAAEQAFFRRLGAFVGEFTLEAAEAVASAAQDQAASTLPTLASLADKGLLMAASATEGEPYFRLLETVRAYALEQLDLAQEACTVYAAHARHYLDLAERVSARLRSAGPLTFASVPAPAGAARSPLPVWTAELDRDLANLRAALIWAQQNDGQAFVRLVGALGRYWWSRGLLREGRDWLEAALAQTDAVDPALRAKMLGSLGAIYRQQANYDRARSTLEEAVNLARRLDDPVLLCGQLIDLGSVLGNQRQFREANVVLHEALELARAAGDTWGTAAALGWLGIAAMMQRHNEEGEGLLAESLSLFRELGDLRSALAVDEALARAIGLQGDSQRAMPVLQDALRLCQELGHHVVIPVLLDATACLLSEEGEPESCARLLGASDWLRVYGYARTTGESTMYEEAHARLRSTLAPDPLAAALSAGQHLSADQALEEALALVQSVMTVATPKPPVPRAERGPLSPREHQVLVLLGNGCSNRDVARELGISENTAKYHVTSILNKLGVNGRAEAVAVAARQGLL